MVWQRRAALTVVVVVVCSCLVTGQVVRVGDQEIFVGDTRDGRDRVPIVGHHLTSGATRQLYRPEQGRVFDFAVSPSGQLVAVLQQILEIDVAPRDATVQLGNGRSVREWRGLRVLTADGAQITETIPLVRQFVWNSDSRQIAYVVGRYQGLDKEDAEPSVWIWDAAEKRSRKIRDGAHHVTWARFDGNLYLLELEKGGAVQVLRLNTATGSLEKTTHRDIYFSPSGEYYYGDAGYGPQENVYLRASDHALKDTSRTLSSLNGFRPLGWAPDADLLLLEASRGPGRDAVSTKMVYDPASDESVDVSKFVATWGKSSKELILVGEDDSVRVVKLSDFGSFR
jgi:hypothetical protein